MDIKQPSIHDRLRQQRTAGHAVPATDRRHALPQTPQVVTDKPKRRRGGSKRRWITIGVIIVLIAGIGFLTYGYITTKRELDRASKPAAAAGQNETDRLVTEIGQYIQLPQETPTLVNVTDASKLKGQEFFANAQNGDKVLVFTEAGRALLYRPSSQQVIEYSKVNL